MSRGLGIPVKLLHESAGHVVSVELKSGELYRGSMIECEDNWNCQLENITFTARVCFFLSQFYRVSPFVRFFVRVRVRVRSYQIRSIVPLKPRNHHLWRQIMPALFFCSDLILNLAFNSIEPYKLNRLCLSPHIQEVAIWLTFQSFLQSYSLYRW